MAVELQVLPREAALPGVGRRLPVREVLVAPGERRPFEATARGELPLGLGRELLAGPGCIGLGVLEGDLDDRMAVAAVDGRPRPARTLPERAGDVLPPVAVVVQRDRAGRRPEDEPARHQELRIGVGVVGGVERSLRDGDVAGLPSEPPELRRGYRPLVHPEAVHPDGPHRCLLRVEVLGAHEELAAGHLGHAGEGRGAHSPPPLRRRAAIGAWTFRCAGTGVSSV